MYSAIPLLCGGNPCGSVEVALRTSDSLQRDACAIGDMLLSHNQMMDETPEYAPFTRMEQDETLKGFDAITIAREAIDAELAKCAGCLGAGTGTCRWEPAEE